MRHVLRARVEAVRALASFFDQLAAGGADKKVYATPYLARAYGGGTAVLEDNDVEGWRRAWEVIEFLRSRGAEIPMLGRMKIQGEWAALSSEGEGYTTSEGIE